MVALLADHRLEAGLLGDMPTILAAATANVWVVGLVKQTSTAIVAKGDTQVRGLAGKRIGYVEASSAHHTWLQALASAGLSESRVKLVALGVDEMPEALARGDRVPPSAYYFRTAVRLCTGAPAWLHLNRMLVLAVGAREQRRVVLDLYAVG